MLHNSEEWLRLKDKWGRRTLWDILGKSRDDELACSQMLGDILSSNGEHGLGVEPVQLFLRVLGYQESWVETVISSDVQSEVFARISYENEPCQGRIDVLVTLKYRDGNEDRIRRMIIETKVRSSEHQMGSNDGPMQTEGYRIWAESTRVDNEDDPIYVFWAPQEVACACTCYKRLSFQTLADRVIAVLLSDERLNARYCFLLKEFLSVLGPSFVYSERKALVMTDEEKALVREFWNSNREELLYVLELIREENTIEITPEDREAIRSAVSAQRTEIVFMIGDEDVDETRFKDRLLALPETQRIVRRTLEFNEGNPIGNDWDAGNISATSSIRANIQSTVWWRQRSASGLTRVVLVLPPIEN